MYEVLRVRHLAFPYIAQRKSAGTARLAWNSPTLNIDQVSRSFSLIASR